MLRKIRTLHQVKLLTRVGTRLSRTILVEFSYINGIRGRVRFRISLSRKMLYARARNSPNNLPISALILNVLLNFVRRYFAEFTSRVFSSFTTMNTVSFRGRNAKVRWDFSWHKAARRSVRYGSALMCSLIVHPRPAYALFPTLPKLPLLSRRFNISFPLYAVLVFS